MNTKQTLVQAIKEMQEGNFTPAIGGVVYGFAYNPASGRTDIFDTAEDDDARCESFDSPAAALDGFKVLGAAIGTYKDITAEPIKNL